MLNSIISTGLTAENLAICSLVSVICGIMIAFTHTQNDNFFEEFRDCAGEFADFGLGGNDDGEWRSRDWRGDYGCIWFGAISNFAGNFCRDHRRIFFSSSGSLIFTLLTTG